MPNSWTPARLCAALVRRFHAARAMTWALRAGVVARRQLRRGGLDAVGLPRVPDVPRGAGRGVEAVLRGTRRTCLERALVRQEWLAARGAPPDLLIGVKPGRPFIAHAWLEGDPPSVSAGYRELSRHRARR